MQLEENKFKEKIQDKLIKSYRKLFESIYNY